MLKRIKAVSFFLIIFLSPAFSVFSESISKETSSTSLPQLDISTYPSQIFWLVVSFFLFYALCAIIIVPRIRKLIKTRRSYITSMMEEANEIAMQAERYEIRAIETLKKSKENAHILFTEKKSKLIDKFHKSATELTTTAQHKISLQVDNLKKSDYAAAPEMIEKISSELTSEIIVKLSNITPEPHLIKKSIKKELINKELVA